MPPFATTGGISVLSRKRNRVCAEPKAASCNTAQFITPGITPKFRMTRRLWVGLYSAALDYVQ